MFFLRYADDTDKTDERRKINPCNLRHLRMKNLKSAFVRFIRVIHEPGSLVRHLVSHLPTPSCSFILDLSGSQCHAGFEDGDFSVAVLLIVSRVAACNTDDKPDKTVANFPHAFALQKRACIEVDPIRFTVI